MAPCLSFPQEWDGCCCLCSASNQSRFFGGGSSQNDSVCYVKAAFPLLGNILKRTEFKENSSNAKRMQAVRMMYSRIDENVDPCIREEDDEERKVRCPPASWGAGLGGMGCPEHPGLGAWSRGGLCTEAGSMVGVKPHPGRSAVPRGHHTGYPTAITPLRSRC